ncbi:MAG: GC-type dockerin domain-anchored protein [Planctomycetota bacterium]
MNRATKTAAVLTAALVGGAAPALGQTASLEVVPQSTTAAPGDLVGVDLIVTFDTAGAPAGAFGSSGLYGFGGEALLLAGNGADASVSGPSVNPSLSFGATAAAGTGSTLLRAAAGRGFAGGLTAGPLSVAGFGFDISAGAADGSFEIGFDGAVVLAIGDQLQTFSTNPGPNQNALTVTSGTIMVMSATTCIADLTTTGATLAGQPGFGVPDGTADLDDLGYFLGFFLNNDASVADVTTSGATLEGQPGFGIPDGSVDLDDLGYYLNFWLLGCP